MKFVAEKFDISKKQIVKQVFHFSKLNDYNIEIRGKKTIYLIDPTHVNIGDYKSEWHSNDKVLYIYIKITQNIWYIISLFVSILFSILGLVLK